MSPFSFVADGMARPAACRASDRQEHVRSDDSIDDEGATARACVPRVSSLRMLNCSLSGPMNPVLRDDRDPFQWRPKLWHNSWSRRGPPGHRMLDRPTRTIGHYKKR